MSARVALVGAGPGDPGLLTRRALYLLRRADLVLYDALVPLEIVDVARRARRFYVGKRAGRHSMTPVSASSPKRSSWPLASFRFRSSTPSTAPS